MEIIKYIKSNDGITTKFVQKITDNLFIETVLVERTEKNIICFSSQIGCPIGCYFCAQSLNKFIRSLNIEELINQCLNVYNFIKDKNKIILFSCMGIGEPLFNRNAIIQTFNILNKIYNNSKFSISTVGILLDELYQLFLDSQNLPIKFQFSVHSPVFNPICLIKYKDLLSIYDVELNYILIKDMNDNYSDAKRLIKIAKGFKVKINKFNKVDGLLYEPSNKIKQFIDFLKEKNIETEYYETNGSNINAACGQLQYSIGNN